MKYHLTAVILLFVTTLSSCKTGDYQSTKSGLQYKVHNSQKKAGKKPVVGDMILIHLVVKTEKDSLLSSSYDPMGMSAGKPIQVEVRKPESQADLMEAFMMLSQGDSATILVNSDSIFSAGQQRPPFIKEHEHIKYYVKLLEVMNKEEYLKKMQNEQMEQMKKDDALLQKYIQDKGLNAKKTESGLYYVIEKEGTGEQAVPGKTVSVHYTGTLLDGTKFDSSVDRGQPFEFVLGQGRVIRGWDEGIALLKKGAKAKLLIPSSMAYGSRAAGTIPANSPLIFDVELLDVK